MAKSDPDFMIHEQMSLDEWVDKTLSPIYDTVYFISSTISLIMDSLELDRSI